MRIQAVRRGVIESGLVTHKLRAYGGEGRSDRVYGMTRSVLPFPFPSSCHVHPSLRRSSRSVAPLLPLVVSYYLDS